MPQLQPSGLQSWYAVYCKPLREWQAAVALEHYLGLAVYLPEVRRRFRGQIQRAPFFPRYLFVGANLQAGTLSCINAIPGVLWLVSFGGTPQAVPAEVIEAIREQVDSLNAWGGVPEHSFHSGDAVRLKDGPLQGLEAIFVGPMKPSERMRVLIHFLGRFSEAEVDVDKLEYVSSGSMPKRERRTRGKGRKIRK
jgi:transcriptional antiterminator RfaH